MSEVLTMLPLDVYSPLLYAPLGVCSKLVLATKESSEEITILQNKVSRTRMHIYIIMMIDICMILMGKQDI